MEDGIVENYALKFFVMIQESSILEAIEFQNNYNDGMNIMEYLKLEKDGPLVSFSPLAGSILIDELLKLPAPKISPELISFLMDSGIAE
jgi:hypothetical protein